MYRLSGKRFEVWWEDDDYTVEDWIRDAENAVAETGAPYVLNGKPLSPENTLSRLREGIQSSLEQEKPAYFPIYLEPLAIWSGIMPPIEVSSETPITASQAQELNAYADRIEALPWRSGVKYFYGHDVDGGPGLLG